jgi:hypothetical protein
MVAVSTFLEIGHSTETRTYRIRPPWEENTPPGNSTRETKSDYHFEQGFYQREQTSLTHPAKEVAKSDFFDRTIQIGRQLRAIWPFFAHIDADVFQEAIIRLVKLLLNEPFERIVLEKTPDDSLLVKACWHDRNVYIDLDFDTDEPDGYEVVIGVYYQKMSILSVAGSFDFTFGEFLALSKSA